MRLSSDFRGSLKELPQIIELAGPAGAGKTALAGALARRHANIALATPPNWRKPGQLPFFARNAVELLPTFIQLSCRRNGNRLQPDEAIRMVLLQGWHRVLQHPPNDGSGVALLDQGPVYMLTAASLIGSGVLKEPLADEWRRRMLMRWANLLDTVIWLDAPNDVLVLRVRSRDVWHGNKVRSDLEAFRFLDDYREAYERTVSGLLDARSDLRILRFDTARSSLDEMCDQVSAALALRGRGRPGAD